jgi:hypothetical protein
VVHRDEAVNAVVEIVETVVGETVAGETATGAKAAVEDVSPNFKTGFPVRWLSKAVATPNCPCSGRPRKALLQARAETETIFLAVEINR